MSQPRKPTGSRSKKPAPQRKRPAEKARSNRPPDLTQLIYAFSDAHALVSVASKVVTDNKHSGPEASVLRLADDALETFADRLDAANIALHHFLKKAVGEGGAS
jgi:hypothetical protein